MRYLRTAVTEWFLCAVATVQLRWFHNEIIEDEYDGFKPRIAVCGVGGAGGNAVNQMIQQKLEGVDFLVCNTDYQALSQSLATNRIYLGRKTTRGLGAGARPDLGAKAAEESLEQIMEILSPYNMVFVAAGLGGGTGTGAAPIIARALKKQGILTVAVVTKPFDFEGGTRRRIALSGIKELKSSVDTMLVVPNQNLFRTANERTTMLDAFKMADSVLYQGVRTITDLIVMPGLINLDFGDVRTIMSEMGSALMGMGEAEGENRSERAAKDAINNPLLDHSSLNGAKGIIINITGGQDLTLVEVDAAAQYIRSEAPPMANIIFGAQVDETMTNKVRVSVVATGLEDPAEAEAAAAAAAAANMAMGSRSRRI